MDPQAAYVRLALDERRLLHERSSILAELGPEEDSETDELPAEAPDEDDDASLLIERERDEGLIAELNAGLLAIVTARRRIELGTYGVCERCGCMIAEERLEVLPATTTCVAHAD